MPRRAGFQQGTPTFVGKGHELDDAYKVAMLRLSLVAGVGPRARRALLDHCGDPHAVLNASAYELRQVRGIGPKACDAIRDAAQSDAYKVELQRCQRHSIEIVVEGDARYPSNLKPIDDPPGVADKGTERGLSGPTDRYRETAERGAGAAASFNWQDGQQDRRDSNRSVFCDRR